MNRRTHKYRIYPTCKQIGQLENTFSMCRHLYNWSLKDRIEACQQSGISLTYETQANGLPELKQERPWFKSVHSQVLQDVLRRLDKGYQGFFRYKRGFPRYKKKGQWSSITYPQFTTRPIGGKLRVPKLGDVKIVYHREIPEDAQIKTLSIVKEAGKWFVCFSLEPSAPPEPKCESHRAIGIDLGVINFITLDDGTRIQLPRFGQKLHKQIRRVHRRLATREKRTPAYLKDLKILKKLWYRVRCARRNFVHQVANFVLEQGDVIIHENLSILRMMERPKPQQDFETGKYLPNGAKRLAKLHALIADACWGEFLRILAYKAKSLGKQVVAVAPAYTSQICSSCGELVLKGLSTRTHLCTTCGYEADRDENAARNIRRLGLQSVGAYAQEAPSIASA